MIRFFRRLIGFYAFALLFCCFLYTGFVTCVGQALFPSSANGSLLFKNGVALTSPLIGQRFASPAYFWGRADFEETKSASGADNAALTDPAFRHHLEKRTESLKTLDPTNPQKPPADLVTGSGSGLDPEISPEAALYQLSRVALARERSPSEIKALIDKATSGRTFGLLGEPRVNLVRLNLLLDGKI